MFSVIIPCFNPGDKLKITLDSVLSQTEVQIEIWVIDGGSSDGTLPVLEDYAALHGVRWLSEADAGIYDAMNKGITRSTGRYLNFLGAGDRLKPSVLAEIQAVAEQQERAGHEFNLLYGNVWWESLGVVFDGPFSQWKFTQKCICHQAIFYSRALFERLGLYDLRYPLSADYAFNIRCFGDAGVNCVFVPLIVADYEGQGLSSTQKDANFIKDVSSLVAANFNWRVRTLYRLRRASPTWLKHLGKPLMRRLKQIADTKDAPHT